MEIKLCMATGEVEITRCGSRQILDTATNEGLLALEVALQQVRDLAEHLPRALSVPALRIVSRELELA